MQATFRKLFPGWCFHFLFTPKPWGCFNHQLGSSYPNSPWDGYFYLQRMGMILDGKLECTWQFFVTFFGWLSDLLNPLKGVKRPPPIGDEKVTTFESFGLNMPGSYEIVISEAPRSLYPIHLPGVGNSPIFTNIFLKEGLVQPPI